LVDENIRKLNEIKDIFDDTKQRSLEDNFYKRLKKESTLRENKVVTNLPELKSSGIAIELTGATEVYDSSQYNNIQLKYPNLPHSHIVVAECDLHGIRFKSFSCMDLQSMQYHFSRYSNGYFSKIRWYSVPIDKLS
jgi:hypothetical protein